MGAVEERCRGGIVRGARGEVGVDCRWGGERGGVRDGGADAVQEFGVFVVVVVVVVVVVFV